MSKTLEGMARAICLAIWDHDYTPRDPLHPDARWLQAMKAAKAGAGFLADRIEENGELTADCKRAAVSAYLAKGQEGRGVVEPVRLMKAISAALRAAAGSAPTTPEVKR